jgi:Protease II
VDGAERPQHWRLGAQELLLLDENVIADQHAFFRLGAMVGDEGEECFFWSADFKGSEYFDIMRVRGDGSHEPVGIDAAAPNFVVCDGGGSILWVGLDDQHRPKDLNLTNLSTNSTKLLYREPDDAYFMSLATSACGRYVFVNLGDHETSEVRWLPRNAAHDLGLIEARKSQIRYSIDIAEDGYWYRLSNIDHENYAIDVSTSPNGPWECLLPGHDERLVEDIDAFAGGVLALVMEDALPKLLVVKHDGSVFQRLQHHEAAYDLEHQMPGDPHAGFVRVHVSSPRMPRTSYDVGLFDGQWTHRKTQVIPSGHDPENYVVTRIDVAVRDGAKVPVTILRHREDVGRAVPFSCMGMVPTACPCQPIFLPQGCRLWIGMWVTPLFTFAVAWSEVTNGIGKESVSINKTAFEIFVDVSNWLVAQGYASPHLAAHGGSAGGMLMGAITNMAPDLYEAIIAEVPFVDVLATMSDPTLPLTPPEWPEWGNPIEDEKAREHIASYSPVDNVTRQAYPAVLATAGLTDPRVTYWEPARWVQQLRAHNTSKNPILMHTEMEAGHAGKTGRYQRLEEVARVYAFALKRLLPSI